MSNLSLLFENRWSFEDSEVSNSEAVEEIESAVRIEAEEDNSAEAAVVDVIDDISETTDIVDDATETAMRLYAYGTQISNNGLSRSSFDAMNYDGIMDKILSNSYISRESINSSPTMDTPAQLCLEGIKDTLKTWKENFLKFCRWLRDKVKDLWNKWFSSSKKKVEAIEAVEKQLEMGSEIDSNKEIMAIHAEKVEKYLRESNKIKEIMAGPTPDQIRTLPEAKAILEADLETSSATTTKAGYDKSKILSMLREAKRSLLKKEIMETSIKTLESKIKELETSVTKVFMETGEDNSALMDELKSKKTDLTLKQEILNKWVINLNKVTNNLIYVARNMIRNNRLPKSA